MKGPVSMVADTSTPYLFITIREGLYNAEKKARLNPSCVLEVASVSLVLHRPGQSAAMSHGMARIRLGKLGRVLVAF